MFSALSLLACSLLVSLMPYHGLRAASPPIISVSPLREGASKKRNNTNLDPSVSIPAVAKIITMLRHGSVGFRKQHYHERRDLERDPVEQSWMSVAPAIRGAYARV